MQDRTSRALRPVVLALALCLAAALSEPASAEEMARSIKTEGEFIAYDAAAKTVTVKVTRRGTGAQADALPSDKPAVFKVESEGSVLTRTNVAIQGVKASLADIPPGRTVNVFWRPDESDPSVRFARKIDVILSDEELDERYGTP